MDYYRIQYNQVVPDPVWCNKWGWEINSKCTNALHRKSINSRMVMRMIIAKRNMVEVNDDERSRCEWMPVEDFRGIDV